MFRNGARSYVDWVTMVTHDSREHIQGPFNASPTLSPVMLMSAPDDVGYIRTPEFFMLGQFSRYIKPGAVRIASGAGTPDRATTVAFRNPDDQVAVVAVNASDFDQDVTIAYRGWEVTGTVPKKAVGTFLWNDGSLSAGMGGSDGGVVDGGGSDGGSVGGSDGGVVDGGVSSGGGGGGGCSATGQGTFASVLALGLAGLLRPRRARTAR
jgi:beta-glucosidase